MGRILILGGTTEAGALAAAVAARGWPAIYSYAGRTQAPVAQPLPQRFGGFGGVDGLVRYLASESVAAVVDATHPFAAQMSANAMQACTEAGVSLVALERAAWVVGEGDRWADVPDIDAAVAALPEARACVFLAIGRQHLAPFDAKPQHRYLLRLVDAPEAPPLPDCEIVVARGPFTLEGDLALLRQHHVGLIVAKNAGGSGARAKLDAARTLGLPVIMIARPSLPRRVTATSVSEVMEWLAHTLRLGV